MNKMRSRHTGVTLVDSTPTDEFIGKCAVCRLPTRVTITDQPGKDYCAITCIHCDDDQPRIDAERLYGVVSRDTCDGACMSATGRLCVCGCGGKNHGKTWGATRESEATASAIEKFYAKEKRNAERRERVAREKREATANAFVDWYKSLSTDERRVIDFIAKYDNLTAYGLDSAFMFDMRSMLVNSHPYIDEDVVIESKPLTEKQFAAVVRSTERTWSFIAGIAEERKSAKPVIEGRYELIGTILSGKVVGGFKKNDYKILVAVEGYKIWGNCPSSLIDEVFISTARDYRAYTGPSGYDFKKGLVIKMTASVRKSERDESFGLFKIAKNAKIVTTVATEPTPAVRVTESAVEQIVDKPATVIETVTDSVPAKRSGSHSTCTHEATKSARAKCRRERGK